MNYDLTALDILKFLGFDRPAGREALETLKKESGLPLPRVYEAFLEAAMDCPVLATSNLWTGKMIPVPIMPRLLFGPAEAAANNLPNYLEIGNDYGSAMLTFGLRVEDLDQEDPLVWMNHEGDPKHLWKPTEERLSDFFWEAAVSALALVNYSTAEDALEKLGWEYDDYTLEYWEAHAEEDDADESGSQVTESALAAKGIDPEKVQWRECSYSGRLFCCLDEEKGALYAGRWDSEDEENTLYTIRRAET